MAIDSVHLSIRESPAGGKPSARCGQYYQIGQVSKFVAPGAIRIDSASTVSYTTQSPYSAFQATPGIDTVAFVNPNGSRVLVANNTSASTQTFAVSYHGQSFEYTLPGGATATFTWN
ncbi:MAG TPA: glycoside hydrolase family 30 beta sandwich domain-containing protein [Solirubrobacteraceae bacterium]